MLCRDIKAENILMESKDSLEIKITDFGFACFYNKEEKKSEILGSPLYMAPEIVSLEPYDNKVDIWSVGVIAYILLAGRPPFKGRSRDEIFASIRFNELNF
jgi:calcium/calmodulin-dependent protein kinase (CaM kinase) II/calcium/calmodulin-dependent protein kinase I